MKKQTKRLWYLCAAVLIIAAEVIIAKYVHDDFVRPYLGDVLVVIAVYTVVRTVHPEGWPLLPAGVFAFAVTVEVLQYFRITEVLGVSDNRFLRILIGGTFDWKDILCYAAGCMLLAVWEMIRAKKMGLRNIEKETQPMKHIEVVAAVIRHGDRIFATQRGYGDFKDRWEFPGGKMEPGESKEAALVREIREELDTDITVEGLIKTVDTDYPAFHITMHVFWCSVVSGELKLLEHEAARWLDINENLPKAVDWLPADLEVVEELLKQAGVQA